MKKILKVICILIGIFILLFLCICSYWKNNYYNKIVKIRDYGILVEHSDLMEPEICKNELIIIKRMNEYDLDDIIAYNNFNNDLLIRKIVQIDEYSFIASTEKNNFTEPDETIEKIEGKVIYHSKILDWIFK